MLQRLHLRNFTVFEDADFAFGPGLNVLVGANGTGKSHVLKAGYGLERSVAEVKSTNRGPEKSKDFADKHETRTSWESILSHFLLGSFSAGWQSLLRRNSNDKQATIESIFWDKFLNSECLLAFTFSDDIYTGIKINVLPNVDFSGKQEIDFPVFIPTKELLSIFPNLNSLNRKYQLAFDITYSELLSALELPLLRRLSPRQTTIISSLKEIMHGEIILSNDRFYLQPSTGERLEINLVAEGIRKFGILAQLINNGTLTPETTLFWDEPEANLNPALLREMAAVLTELAKAGYQIIMATHSLFLLKELHILARQEQQPVRYFGLSAQPGEATTVATADNLELLPDIVALDAELDQSDRFQRVLDQEDADRN